ncbi:spermatogenesis-associated protein 24 isoform X3 [Choloepus didactylus]|uniref:spermatogenesis-associated protein 24 isoform X3 n=1 Tax=Choloepus didactylus TaxID=27675 RepID=UPI00189C66E2|nr:spermatogenesis-associated protein 24 isoform X3 [Choloepus didactylus]
MATPVGWSQGGSRSVCLAFDQLRDVIESQEELIHQLRNVMALQDENFVSKEEFQAVEKKLVEEKAAHAKTKVLLAKEEEKLQFALGEVEVLTKQLEKEKLAFEKALSNVKSKALQESCKKDQLITKCNAVIRGTTGPAHRPLTSVLETQKGVGTVEMWRAMCSLKGLAPLLQECGPSVSEKETGNQVLMATSLIFWC